MSVAAPLVRRQLLRGCIAAVCTATQTVRRAQRFASTTTSPASSSLSVSSSSMPTGFQIIQAKDGRIRTAFAVYGNSPTSAASKALLPPAALPASSSSTPPKVDVRQAYDAQQIARRDPTGARTALFSRRNPHSAKPGDVLLVSSSKAGSTDSFAGVCLAIRRRGIETAILLRGQLAKTGVEMWFKIYSRAVGAIDIVQRSPRRARRAKLTFMRHPKHDRGSVEDLVRAWRRGRNVVRSHGRAKQPPSKK